MDSLMSIARGALSDFYWEKEANYEVKVMDRYGLPLWL
jgi:hypothetical protein